MVQLILIIGFAIALGIPLMILLLAGLALYVQWLLAMALPWAIVSVIEIFEWLQRKWEA